MNYKRKEFQQLKNRLEEKRKYLQVLLGPRQVGKTTLVLQVLSALKTPHLYVSADSVFGAEYNWIAQQWESVRIKMKIENINEYVLVFDEIQKIPNWSEIVKSQWDSDTKNKLRIKVILLGSSNLMISKGLTESLAGRFETTKLTYWRFEEMKKAFSYSAEEFAYFGGYPGAASLIRDERRWRDYVNDSLIETTISKDILLLTKIDKPQILKNLFQIGCAYSSQLVSLTKVLGQLQDVGNTTTLSHYLALLDSSELIRGLQKFSKELIRRKASIPKFQVFNTALITAQSSKSFSETLGDSAYWGRLVESVVGAHLLNSSVTEGFNIFYWRVGDDEVDFILTRGEKVIALEVKSNADSKSKGLASFSKLYNVSKSILISNNGLSWKDFIKISPSELF